MQKDGWYILICLLLYSAFGYYNLGIISVVKLSGDRNVNHLSSFANYCIECFVFFKNLYLISCWRSTRVNCSFNIRVFVFICSYCQWRKRRFVQMDVSVVHFFKYNCKFLILTLAYHSGSKGPRTFLRLNFKYLNEIETGL